MENRHGGVMKTNRGVSLMEVLITVAVMAIVTGVGTHQYGKYMDKAECQSLKDSAKLFVNAFSACTKSSGGWFIGQLKSDGQVCRKKPCTDTSHNHYPCKAIAVAGTTTATTTTGTVSMEKALKKINYTCPIATEDTDNKCETVVGTTASGYFCLSIKKKIGGDKHQIVALVNAKDPTEYQVYCRKSTTYVDLAESNCSKESTVYKAWNAGNTNKQCEWPVPSNATAPPSG